MMPTRPTIIGYRKTGAPIWQIAGGAPTIEEIIGSVEMERELAIKRRDRAVAEVKDILNRAREAGRSNLTSEEDADTERAFERSKQAREELTGIDAKLRNARRLQTEERDNQAALEQRFANPKAESAQLPKYDQVARVGREERTYHQGNDRNGGAFIRDVTKQFLYRDMESESRLIRHMAEEKVERGQYLQRASGTGNFTGLTVPQYLTDMYAPKVAALRPFADQCNHHDLPPDGMSINISKITTGTNAQLQASENAAITPDSAISDTLLTEAVQTAAGQQTLSRQAIDRGTGIEDVTMDDLFRRYATTLDSTLINQATTGLAAISTSQSLTTTTTATLWGSMIQGAAAVEAVLLGWAAPDLVVMNPRRWYKLLSALSNTWPLAYGNNPPGDPVQATIINKELGYNRGNRGALPNGLNVCVDANVTTVGLAQAITGGTQDQIYVVPTQECHLWEDPNAPVFIRAEQPAAANLGVLLVLYGYFAYTFRRFPGATININGAGLVPPVFDGT